MDFCFAISNSEFQIHNTNILLNINHYNKKRKTKQKSTAWTNAPKHKQRRNSKPFSRFFTFLEESVIRILWTTSWGSSNPGFVGFIAWYAMIFLGFSESTPTWYKVNKIDWVVNISQLSYWVLPEAESRRSGRQRRSWYTENGTNFFLRMSDEFVGRNIN